MVEEGEKEEDENPSSVEIVVESCDSERDLELEKKTKEGGKDKVQPKRERARGRRLSIRLSTRTGRARIEEVKI